MRTDAYPLEKPYQIPVNDRMLINTFSVAKASVSLAFQDAFQFFSQDQRETLALATLNVLMSILSFTGI
jgi:hypothetical protein